MGILIAVLIIIGAFFGFVGMLGILRMPDVYSRLQASTCIATMSTICINAAGILYVIAEGLNGSTIIKLIILTFLVLVTNPISNHALCKAAYRSGISSAKPFVMDDHEADFGSKGHTKEEADLSDGVQSVDVIDETAQPAEDPEDKEEAETDE